jgi:hypothetical protein
MESVLLGAEIISPQQGNWQEQLALFRSMKPTIVKMNMTKGWGTTPAHVETVIKENPGITVMLCIKNCYITTPEALSALEDGGFHALMKKYPGTQFIIEVGNEPEYCTGDTAMDAWQYRWHLLNTRKALKPKYGLNNLQWIASLPVHYDWYSAVLTGGDVLDAYDGVGVHVYGHYNWGDAGEHGRIYEHAIRLGVPVHVTELGIHDTKTTSQRTKAERILVAKRDAKETVKSFIQFAVATDNPDWKGYLLTKEMAAVYAARNETKEEYVPPKWGDCRTFTETGFTVCGPFHAFWKKHGLMLMGFPISSVVHEYGRPTQYFERCVMEWHANNPPEFQVLLRHLGRESYARR